MKRTKHHNSPQVICPNSSICWLWAIWLLRLFTLSACAKKQGVKGMENAHSLSEANQRYLRAQA
jgi:hypothetical protein